MGKKVLIGVCGGIAAYKAIEVMRGLQKLGHDVQVILTKSATQFVTAQTFQVLSGHPVYVDDYVTDERPVAHISLAAECDLFLIVPATGNIMAKAANGIADDLLSSTILACYKPIAIAPAMNVHMWRQNATQRNLKTLQDDGVHFIMPTTGHLACGYEGEGKLASVDEIVTTTHHLLTDSHELAQKNILVTAGPTKEDIDPVRYISNRSSGKMGYAIVDALVARGANVTLITGETGMKPPYGARVINVRSASDMYAAAMSEFDDCDGAICVAAVADYTPANPASHKLKKDAELLDVINLVETKDILAALGGAKGERPVIGFAAETNDLIDNAVAKLERKGVDMLVANDVSESDSTFGSDTNKITFVSHNKVEELPLMSKLEVAEKIVDRLSDLYDLDM